MTNTKVSAEAWNESEHPVYIYLDGKTLVMPFDVILNEPKLQIGIFLLKKISYINRMVGYTTDQDEPVRGVCHYLNYFINEYDDDKETVLSYLKLKYQIDNKNTQHTAEEFKTIIHSVLITDTMIEKIEKMVEDNYTIDLTPAGKDFEQLEFTNEHAKIMMKISSAMKLMIAPMMHYINTNNIKGKDVIYDIFLPLFERFGGEDTDIYAKLWYTINSRVRTSVQRNSIMWDQHEVYGAEPTVQAQKILREDIITETMFRYTFGGNIISLNSAVLNAQIGYFNQTKHPHNLVEVDNTKNAEGLSGMDKLEMNSQKVDESLSIITKVNTRQLIDSIQKSMGMVIEKEEIQYYLDNHNISKTQSDFVFYYYAKYFGYNDLRQLNRKNYMRLLIILKRKLQYMDFVYLPQILSGNLQKLSKRTIRNQKFSQRIESSDVYINIMENKFPAFKELGKTDHIIKHLSMFLNSQFTYVDYDDQDLTGEILEVIVPDTLSGEILEYINMI